MDTFTEVSAWLQIMMMVAMILLARMVAAQFSSFTAWRTIWIAFSVGFTGMLESRVFIILFAYGIEDPWMRGANRYVTPLQASVGLFVGMLLWARMIRQMRPLRELIHLPHQAGFVVDRQSVILAWDAGAHDLFGWSAEDAMGHTLMEMITPLRIRATHTPLVERYAMADPGTGLSQRYTITARYRDTLTEFSAEVILTAEPQGNGTVQYKGIARRLEVSP